MYYKDRETNAANAATYVRQQKTAARDRLKANAKWKKENRKNG